MNRGLSVLVWVVFSFLFFVLPVKAQITFLFTVNTTSDTVVANACHNGTAGCSLRGAIQAANAAGASTMVFAIPANDPFCTSGVCTINLTQALPDITVSTEIDGPGADKLTVRNGTAGQYRIFTITTASAVTLFGMTISNGNAGNIAGGGIRNQGSATVNLINCTISGNNTSQNGGGGIANVNGGTLNVTNSTISGNSALFGGGIYNSATMNVTNSTLSGNSATGNNEGGGIFAGGGTLNVTNSTISGNNGSLSGGGIRHPSESGIVSVKNSIIALNNTSTGTGPDVQGDFFSAGFNLIGKRDGSTGFTAATDQTGTVASPLDPKLDPNGLQNNGGPTKTIALLFGSPAIDKATSNGLTGNLTTDQRGSGFKRAFDDTSIANAAGGDGTDIGAFEVQTAAPTVLANISTRLPVQTGDNVLIGGFIVTGTQPKKVILRALGPSVPVPGTLANPVLELYSGSTLLESNDNWVDSPNKQAIIDTDIPPSNNLESAIVRTLPANSSGYTAIVRGVSNGTGIGVVEAYDLDRSVDSKLANISTRGLVQTGDNVLIAGTIILGQNPQKVIVRAIGPSLSVPGKLADPTLELHDGNGALLEANDNWVDSPNKQAIIDSGIPPSDNRESAIVRTLPANGAQYTAILRGVNNTTGIAVVEAYALQ
jgi:CSLREA domain-containing protein